MSKTDAPRFALGTRVVTTAEAFVIRKRRDVWFVPVKGNFYVPSTTLLGEERMKVLVGFNPIEFRDIEHIVEPKEGTNKSVGIVLRERSGIIIGREKKMIGKSVSSRYDEEPCGWFEQSGHVWLWIVRNDLHTVPFYAPDAHVTLSELKI